MIKIRRSKMEERKYVLTEDEFKKQIVSGIPLLLFYIVMNVFIAFLLVLILTSIIL